MDALSGLGGGGGQSSPAMTPTGLGAEGPLGEKPAMPAPDEPPYFPEKWYAKHFLFSRLNSPSGSSFNMSAKLLISLLEI